jgi:DNA polymerase III epsilon subunit-like protein
MTKTYSGLVNLNGNLMAAVDVETTGVRAGYHEIIQIAVVPLNSDIRPLAGIRPFYTTVKPLYPERWDKASGHVHQLKLEDLLLYAPEPDRVADLFVEWVAKLELPFDKRLAPLAANWPFEAGFLQAWLGTDQTQEIFNFAHVRDVMIVARHMNDKAAFAGETAPFNRVGLGSLCRRLNVVNANPHDALADAMAEAEVYRSMLRIDLF